MIRNSLSGKNKQSFSFHFLFAKYSQILGYSIQIVKLNCAGDFLRHILEIYETLRVTQPLNL